MLPAVTVAVGTQDKVKGRGGRRMASLSCWDADSVDCTGNGRTWPVESAVSASAVWGNVVWQAPGSC